MKVALREISPTPCPVKSAQHRLSVAGSPLAEPPSVLFEWRLAVSFDVGTVQAYGVLAGDCERGCGVCTQIRVSQHDIAGMPPLWVATGQAAKLADSDLDSRRFRRAWRVGIVGGYWVGALTVFPRWV